MQNNIKFFEMYWSVNFNGKWNDLRDITGALAQIGLNLAINILVQCFLHKVGGESSIYKTYLEIDPFHC